MNTPLIALGLVALAGCAVALQTPINAALGRSLGSGVAAAAVSFGVGFLVLLAVLSLSGDIGSLGRITMAPPVLFIGGALGAFYVWTVLWAIPTLGALTTITALILGQLSAALLIDAAGLFGLAVQAITPIRLAAAALVGAGVVLSRF
ncbi:DMT family transporter [Sulfitobacter mediterraneus]|uniref:Amidophosphoribosyltransferase n=1 Tax=Sulfitobacter mediterraneus TaxID=83219 RepID=A0A061SX89_9RHOB|nr:DMT family transporter [Sulfitobacter mediterraneus]KAJ04455.1 amidophosphoribosyltransferase [Sulfitobacter mediterraneus]